MAAPTEFGVWLKVEREARDWTQAELAQHIGVSANTVARWERGEVTPSALAQAGVREALGKRGKRG
jgi:transcriptional regulator with XRE-family HTH domain